MSAHKLLCSGFRRLSMVVSFVSLLLCSLSCQRNADEGRHPPEKFLGGTLPLQGQVGVISVYGNDTTGQRGVGLGVGFAVFNGHKPLFAQSREKSHNETWQFEQGLLVLVTKTSESGAILERMFSARDSSGADTFTYCDTDGDGQWDVLVDFAKRQKFIRKGLTWVPSEGNEGNEGRERFVPQ